jgi:hypothetical protein
MSEEATNPVEDEVIDTASEEGVADEAHQAQGDDQDTSEETEEVQPDDDEEIEHEGQKYKVPKALKESFLRQADYTRKTQELAEQRRTVEARHAEIAQQAELHAQTLTERVQLKTVEDQLAQYNNVDWRQYTAQYGAEETATAMAQWQQLRDAQSSLTNAISSKETEHRLSGERMAATALQEAEQVLAKEIKGYGPDLVRNIAQTASTIGFTPQELRDSLIGENGKADVRSFKVLAELHELRAFKAQHETKTQKAQTAEKQASVQPAKTVGQKSGGYKPGLDDSLPPDEWHRRFIAQRKRG